MSATFSPVRLVSDSWIRGDGIEGLNVSESNACAVLASLGLNPCFNEAEPVSLELFEAECATFLRIASGSEVDASINPRTKKSGGAVWVDCARREGYLSERINQLLVLARVGFAAGCTHMVCV